MTKEAMTKDATPKIAAAAALSIAVLAGSSPALAQRYTNYPVCAVYSFRTQSCAFQNFAQCYMSVSGRGGWCEANPFYEPPRTRRGTKRRS
jgi:hypothetical protein